MAKKPLTTEEKAAAALVKSERMKKINAEKRAAKEAAPKAENKSSFDLEKEHEKQLAQNSNLLGFQQKFDAKLSYEQSLPFAKTAEQKRHLESVLSSHNHRKDS